MVQLGIVNEMAEIVSGLQEVRVLKITMSSLLGHWYQVTQNSVG